jgi:hypothetical protein
MPDRAVVEQRIAMEKMIHLDEPPYMEAPEDPDSSPIWSTYNGVLIECHTRCVDQAPSEMRDLGYIEVANPHPFGELWCKESMLAEGLPLIEREVLV